MKKVLIPFFTLFIISLIGCSGTKGVNHKERALELLDIIEKVPKMSDIYHVETASSRSAVDPANSVHVDETYTSFPKDLKYIDTFGDGFVSMWESFGNVIVNAKLDKAITNKYSPDLDTWFGFVQTANGLPLYMHLSYDEDNDASVITRYFNDDESNLDNIECSRFSYDENGKAEATITFKQYHVSDNERTLNQGATVKFKENQSWIGYWEYEQETFDNSMSGSIHEKQKCYYVVNVNLTKRDPEVIYYLNQYTYDYDTGVFKGFYFTPAYHLVKGKISYTIQSYADSTLESGHEWLFTSFDNAGTAYASVAVSHGTPLGDMYPVSIDLYKLNGWDKIDYYHRPEDTSGYGGERYLTIGEHVYGGVAWSDYEEFDGRKWQVSAMPSNSHYYVPCITLFVPMAEVQDIQDIVLDWLESLGLSFKQAGYETLFELRNNIDNVAKDVFGKENIANLTKEEFEAFFETIYVEYDGENEIDIFMKYKSSNEIENFLWDGVQLMSDEDYRPR